LAKNKAQTGKQAVTQSTGPMDTALLERIVKLMTANDLNTVDVRDGDKRVILKRGAVVGPTVYASPGYSSGAHASQAGLATGMSSGASSAGVSTATASEDASLIPIKSPMVGTFYSAATPEAKAFVTVGTQIDEDTDVCIIEAMKVFNNIKAETRGTITKVLATNGQTVEFGQPLFLVKQ